MNPQDVECPTCEAQPGQKCDWTVTKSDVGSHGARHREAHTVDIKEC